MQPEIVLGVLAVTTPLVQKSTAEGVSVRLCALEHSSGRLGLSEIDTKCGCDPITGPIQIAVITLSDTRTMEDDRSGQAVVDLVTAAGHQVCQREIIRDECEPLEALLRQWTSAKAGVDAIITTGGTGLAIRDQTIDVVSRWLDAELPGFGEHFRRLSFDEIGAPAMLSRAVAGRVGQTMVFCLPGSTGGVRTGVSKCVLPILPHSVGLLS